MKLHVDIEKKYGNFILKSSFTTDGERLALLGASGCGKSLTLKCIAGIEKPDRGKIVLGDRVLFDHEKKINLPARERCVGYLFQDYALFPNMTVEKNICCAASDKEYARELIKRFGLLGLEKQYPAELSGGQSQRTALARMLAAKPEVILLDEPFSALDNYMRTRMEHEILDLFEEFEGPSVLVTHDRNEAYRLADRIGVMEAGRVVELQGRQEFFDNPKTVAAARLTGCKNISRIKSEKTDTILTEDWGVSIALDNINVPSGATHVGYRAHYFSYVKDDRDMINTFRCRLCRVIEDTFSVVVCFNIEGNTNDNSDALLTWIVGKEDWDNVKIDVLSGTFALKVNPGRLMFLN
ncbi:MAG: ATP-binding cassette domain-containing protein [Lachnospiraceae bacterium]|nr:ATP-binding cassette domain-containing protein [Lachnospiraceae bacterium]